MAKSTSFLVSLGDSFDGPLGACIRVTLPAGSTPEQAVEKIRKFLEKLETLDGIHLFRGEATGDRDKQGIEYVHVYINPAKITAKEISEGETEIVG